MSRASYYRWAKPAGLTPTAIRHSELRAEVAQEFEKSNQMAGRDQLTTLLNQRGVKVSTGTVCQAPGFVEGHLLQFQAA